MLYSFTYRPTEHIQVQFNATCKDAFKALAELDETFGETTCQACGGTDTRYVVRVVDSNSFPEIRCLNKKCGSRLAFGQSKDQATIYPRRKFHKEHPQVKARKAEAGDWIPNGGWEKFSPRDNQND